MTAALQDSADAPDGGVRVDNSGSAELTSLYRERAKRYDRSTLLLYYAGFRHGTYRKRAIQSPTLSHGETVVDLGCGTGLIFSLLQEQVGPRERIIGVDFADAMLDEARARDAAHGWSNVEMVKSDAAVYVSPLAVDGILSAFALTWFPNLMRLYGMELWRCSRERASLSWTSKDLQGGS